MGSISATFYKLFGELFFFFALPVDLDTIEKKDDFRCRVTTLNIKTMKTSIFTPFISLLFVLIASGCRSDDSCVRGDNRNVRKVFSLETPSFPNRTLGSNMVIPENPAGLLFLNNESVGDVFDVCEVINDQSDFVSHDKWIMELDVNGQCANQERYDQYYRPTQNGDNIFCTYGSANRLREMPIQSSNVGSTIIMCPDPHRPNNHGFASYDFTLIIQSPYYLVNPAAGDCSGCPGDSYRVTMRTDLKLDFVGFDDFTQCLAPQVMLPFSAILAECL
ncbi:MAG: hypothetical protein R2795_12525 [Saprospiraceae bacterium]